VISGCLLALGLLITPWALVLVLLVGVGGPLLSRTDGARASGLGRLGRIEWASLALGLASVLLLLNRGGSLVALLLALIPVAWALITDRSLLQSTDGTDRRLQPTALPDEEEPEVAAEMAEGEELTETEPALADQPGTPLAGSELLARIKEIGDVGKSDIVRACGYVGLRPDGPPLSTKHSWRPRESMPQETHQMTKLTTTYRLTNDS